MQFIVGLVTSSFLLLVPVIKGSSWVEHELPSAGTSRYFGSVMVIVRITFLKNKVPLAPFLSLYHFFFFFFSQDSMRGMNPSTLQSMFQANHMGKAGLYDNQGGKMKKKQPLMLHSDPSILGM